MLPFFNFHFGHKQPPQYGTARTVLLFNGLLCVLFGLAILSAPELLAYFVASLLIILGVSLLTTWWKLRR